jgi:hypothetical protein
MMDDWAHALCSGRFIVTMRPEHRACALHKRLFGRYQIDIRPAPDAPG